MADGAAWPTERRKALTERLFPVAALALLLGGLFARLTTWINVFTPHGLALKLSDSHYYVRFARMQLHAFPRFVDFDPFINYPGGAHIIWPPFHAWLLALAIALFGEGRAELAAAWLGPAIGVAELLLVAVLARRWFGAAFSLAVTFGLAFIPVCAEASALGNADHHAHEFILVALGILSLSRAVESQQRGDALVAGVILGLGRFFTTVSFVVFPMAALGLVVLALVRPERAASCARVGRTTALVAAPLLFVGAVLFGLPWSLQYEAFSSFHALLAGGVLAGAAALCAFRAKDRRGAVQLCAAAVVLLLPAAVGLLRAGSHLGRGDPLLKAVTESLPLYADPGWALELFSLPLLLAPLVLIGIAVAAWRGSPLGVFTSAFAFPLIAAAIAQVRFTQPLGGAYAVALPVAFVALAERMKLPLRTAMAISAAAVALVTAWYSVHPDEPETGYDAAGLIKPTLEWIRTRTPPASSDPFSPDIKPDYAVVASRFDFGHLIVLWAERPVVGSPFGQTPWHIAGNQRASDVLAASDDETGYQLARATGARYVLATPFGPLLGREEVDRQKTLAHHLLEDGMLTRTGHFRLVHDSKEQRSRKEGGTFARVFEVVDGAVLRGTTQPGAQVTVELALRDNTGQTLRYQREAKADAGGQWEVRVAYPTAKLHSDFVSADGPYRIISGAASAEAEVDEEQVRRGGDVAVPQLR